MKTQKFTFLAIVLLMISSVVTLAQNSRLQVIHNSADQAAAEVDVYLDDVLLLDNFAYLHATSFIDGPVGTAKIDIAPANSSSSADAIYTVSPTFEEGGTYVVVASGNVSSSGYSQTENFMLHVFNMGRESAGTSGNTDVLVFHGSADAPTVDIYESTAGALADNVAYGAFAGYLELPASDYTLEVRDETGSSTVATYSAPLSTLGLADSAITVIASGFLSPESNSNGKVFGLHAVLANGDVVALPYASEARAQVIHNSADAAAETVDVYLNDGLLINDFEFRTASAFIDAPAGAPIKLNVAPSNSHGSGDAIYTVTTTLEADETYILLANGNVSASGYSVTENFGIEVFGQGMESTSKTDTTAVLVAHGSTDAPTVDIYEATGPAELAGDLMYNDFAGYLNLPTSDYILEVRDETSENIVARYTAPLSTLGLDGDAITVVASGFLDPSTNSNEDAFGLFVATAGGGALLALDAPETVFDVVLNSTDHTTLETAIMAAGLNGTLSDEGKFTVFAPTDAAFDALPSGVLDALLQDPTGNLAQVLLYHVAGDSVRSSELTDEQMIASLQGQNLEVSLDGGVFINGAEVTAADIKQDNGIVHVIDAVLVPQNDVAISDDATYGNILTDADGNTLYFFTNDVNDTSVCVDGCITNWPAFYTEGLFLPEGLNRDDFGSFERPDGALQTTYKGWPLYSFANDAQAGDINGEGVNDVWFVAKPNYSIMLMDNQLVGNDGLNYTGDYTEGEEIIQYFTDDYGRTLYTWINDAENTNNFTAEDFPNNNVWPIYEEDSIIVPSTLTSGLFDTINVYGRTQMTYNGWPLYYFGSDDAMRGSTKGVSVPSPGVWPVAVADISDPLPATIVDIVVESEAHTTLETAVIEAELAGSLSGDGPFTVFAPTDDAFAALPDGTLDALLADPTGELAEILQFHVVSGKAMSGDLSDGMKVATLQGDSIMISIDGENVSVNGANVTMADIEAQNGVVHVIDAVLLPEEPTSITETIFTSNATLVYPNPAKDRATIRYSIESNANVTLEIYNVLGSKVEMINLGSKPKGTYRQEFSVSQFKNGIYFVVLQAGNDSSRDILRVVNE